MEERAEWVPRLRWQRPLQPYFVVSAQTWLQARRCLGRDSPGLSRHYFRPGWQPLSTCIKVCGLAASETGGQVTIRLLPRESSLPHTNGGSYSKWAGRLAALLDGGYLRAAFLGFSLYFCRKAPPGGDDVWHWAFAPSQIHDAESHRREVLQCRACPHNSQLCPSAAACAYTPC